MGRKGSKKKNPPTLEIKTNDREMRSYRSATPPPV